MEVASFSRELQSFELLRNAGRAEKKGALPFGLLIDAGRTVEKRALPLGLLIDAVRSVEKRGASCVLKNHLKHIRGGGLSAFFRPKDSLRFYDSPHGVTIDHHRKSLQENDELLLAALASQIPFEPYQDEEGIDYKTVTLEEWIKRCATGLKECTDLIFSSESFTDLSNLPTPMLINLESLDLSFNNFTSIPVCLFLLPHSQDGPVVDLSGNPIIFNDETRAMLRDLTETKGLFFVMESKITSPLSRFINALNIEKTLKHTLVIIFFLNPYQPIITCNKKPNYL